MLIQGSVAVAAGATNDNVFANSQFEYLPSNCRVEIGLNGSAAGLLADVFSGPDILAENMALNAQNRMPVYPDDFPLVDGALGGQRLKSRVRNPTGGSLTVFFAARLTPI